MASVIQSGRRRKAELTVLTNKSIGDSAQVPSVGSTCQVYLQGATVRSATGSPISGAGATIPISHPGTIEIGDVLQNGTTSSPTLTVTAINRVQSGNKFTWTLTVTPSASFTFAADDRLINTSRRPTIYKDPGDDVSYGGSSTTTSSTGLLRFYTIARAVDVIVAADGTPAVSTFVIRDIDTSDTGYTVNVQDFGGSIKRAYEYLVDRAQSSGFTEYGSIYVPTGVYQYDSAEMDIVITAPVRIFGDGPLNTRIFALPGNENTNLFTLSGDWCVLEEMALYGVANTSGTGEGIRIGSASGAVGYVQIKHLFVVDWSSYALNIGSVSGVVNWGDLLIIENCLFGGSKANAQVRVGIATTVTKFLCCRIRAGGSSHTSAAGVEGVFIEGAANVVFDTCDGAPTSDGTSFMVVQGNGGGLGDQDGSCQILIDNCDWEWGTTPGGSANTPLLSFTDCSSVTVRNTLLFQFGSGVLFDNCRSVVVENLVAKAISTNTGAYKIKLTDCKNPVIIGGHEEAADGTPNFGAWSDLSWEESGSTSGVLAFVNGVVQLPRYANASLPAATANKILNGSVAYDTTNNKLVCLVSGAWTAMH